jgi:hypothetical protein
MEHPTVSQPVNGTSRCIVREDNHNYGTMGRTNIFQDGVGTVVRHTQRYVGPSSSFRDMLLQDARAGVAQHASVMKLRAYRMLRRRRTLQRMPLCDATSNPL